MMCLVEERKRQSTKVFAQFMERLVGDHGDAAIAREMCLDFRWSF
jgi:hypothetical protein